MATVSSSTKNHDIDYIVKDFDSSVDALINFANVNFGSGTSANRLWTNFNVDSFSRNWLEIVAYVADLFFFYFDVQSTQAYLQTATIRSAVKDIAKQFGFVPATATSASGTETFSVTAAGTIPRGFRVRSSTGVEFFLTNAIIASAAGNFTGSVLQGQIFNEQFSSQGLQSEEFDLSGIQIVRDLTNANPQDISPQVVVAGNAYTLVNTFIRNNGTDTAAVVDSLGAIIGGGGRVFTLEERPNGKKFIRFGDGVFGRKLVPGELITVTYRVGGGSTGNVAEQSVITAVDSNPIVASVTNAGKFSGGADEQSIEQLRELIPASLRTLDRAVAESDYSDILEATFTEVSSASTERNTDDPGIDLNIYVVPTGVGISKITDNLPLKNKLSSFLERRKMVTIQFAILDAFGIDVLLSLKVFVIDTASKTTVKNAIDTAFTNYFNLLTGGADGSGIGFAEKILTEDLTSILEGISGIERFEFTRHTYRPRVQQNVLGLNTDYTNSQVEVFPNVSESEWLLGASGQVTKTSGTLIFSNTLLTGFTYNPINGKVTYSAAVDLDGIAPGDLFRGGAGLAEITTVKTRTDGVGVAEVSKVITTADQEGYSEVTNITTTAGTLLGGKYFKIYDTAGSVAVWFNTGSSTQPSHGANRAIMVNILVGDTANQIAGKLQTALNADSEFTASVLTNVVTATLDQKFTVADAVDGHSGATTGFTFLVTQQGETPQSLSGKYFDIYDNVGPVRCWYNVTALIPASVAPTTPGGGRLLQINIGINDSANAVASATQAAVDADAQFTATVSTNTVTITDVAVGPRTDISVGTSGFTVSVFTQGAAASSLGGTYFDMADTAGPVRVWFDVDNLSVAPAVPFGGRLIEVDITAGAVANTVATALKNKMDADAQYSATVVTDTVTITDVVIGSRTDATDFNTGFTIAATQDGTPNNADYTIFGVNTKLYTLDLAPGQEVSTSVSTANHGSVRTGSTISEAFKCFKKLNATATNLSIDSITDNELNLSIKTGTGTPLSARVLLDNTQVFKANQYATGDFYLVDSAGNIWEIVENTSNTIKTSITAVNDASISAVASGGYQIVTKLVGYQVVFNGSIFTIQFNSDKTVYSVGAQFANIGTIGDTFQISKLQDNVGTLGIAADLVSYDASNQQILLNDAPDLQGVSSDWSLIDKDGKVFNIVGIDNRSLPSTFYENTSQDSSFILEDTGLGVQYAQGFQVSSQNVYSVVSFYLKKAGNVVGNLTAKIVADDGTGLPNLASVVSTSQPVNINTLNVITGFDSVSTNPNTGFDKIIFSFTTPPTLFAGVQYHLVISGDASYVASQVDNVKSFDNALNVAYTYNGGSGIIQYASPIDLSVVQPGHYFRDGAGKLFRILSVSDGDERVTLATGLAIDTSINLDSGSIYKKDSLYVAADGSSPTYGNGKGSRYDGSVWANDAQGPVPNRFSSNTDFAFSVEGPKSIIIDSNLTPSLGAGATISKRYYDDDSEISLILGLSNGTITSAADVTAIGRGTVNTIPNSKVDSFVFRTSHFVDDIVNLRLNEIPQYSSANAMIEVFGGVD